MGCATSKPKVCRNCQSSLSPIRRSYSVHKPDDHAVVLTSSTLGSLNLDPFRATGNKPADAGSTYPSAGNGKTTKEEFAIGMIEAKTWSEMINDKIPKTPPKTPTQTPPGEPETINAWEMMEGLDDISPLRPARHLRSFSFQLPPKPCFSSSDLPTPRVIKTIHEDSDDNPPTPIDNSIISDFDPDMIATFRKALEELPPANPFHLKPMPGEKHSHSPLRKTTAKVAPCVAEKLIVYFTSLRGVRKTYEDCCHVRVILKGLGVKVDERDVSMHSGFKEELRELSGGVGLPRVFIGREFIGGAEEIRRMNEEGNLEKLVEFCEADDFELGRNCKVCEACGDIRFVPCETCSGSCKIYYEEEFEDGEDEEDEVDESEGEFGFHRCPDCNENGLIRCPICCV